MSPVVIILGILIIILCYFLYSYFASTSATLQTSASLKTVIPAITKLNNPTYTRYSYGIWAYVNSWDNTVPKTIFSRNQNLQLYLAQSAPTLNLDMIMTDNTTQTLSITDNFPLQKWVNIIISVDNQFVDVYLNGKLVKSQRFITPNGGMPAGPPDTNTPVNLGNSGSSPFSPFDTYITGFTRWTTPMDPQTAWNVYMAGNGTGVANAVSGYGANLAILKNNVQQSQYTLF